MTCATDRAHMANELRWLMACAVAGGADRNRAQALAGHLVDLLLDADDPRRKRSLTLAARVQSAYKAGVTVRDLGARFGKSSSQINRLLTIWAAHDFMRRLPDSIASIDQPEDA